MKKSLIALASAALVAPAFAQSSVTLQGTVDMALTHGTASGAGSASVTQLSTGGNSTSKLIFRGIEDLGGGMSASFWLESQLYTDSGAAGREGVAQNQGITSARGSGLSFTRRSTVSLAGGWGELRLGRDFTPTNYNVSRTDPFANVGVGTSLLVTAPSNGLNAGVPFSLVPAGQGTSGPVTRTSNQITYFTPSKLGGFYGQLSYWLGENPENGAVNEDDGTGGGARAGYRAGPFDIAAAWAKTKYRGTPVATSPGAPSGDYITWNVGAEYDFGPAKLMAGYSREQRDSAVQAEGTGWILSGMVPLGAHQLKVAFSQYEIDGGAGADPRARLLAVGDVYSLSKRTAIYLTVARVRNSNGARIALGGSVIGTGVGNANSTGVDLGIRHHF